MCKDKTGEPFRNNQIAQPLLKVKSDTKLPLQIIHPLNSKHPLPQIKTKNLHSYSYQNTKAPVPLSRFGHPVLLRFKNVAAPLYT